MYNLPKPNEDYERIPSMISSVSVAHTPHSNLTNSNIDESSKSKVNRRDFINLLNTHNSPEKKLIKLKNRTISMENVYGRNYKQIQSNNNALFTPEKRDIGDLSASKLVSSDGSENKNRELGEIAFRESIMYRREKTPNLTENRAEQVSGEKIKDEIQLEMERKEKDKEKNSKRRKSIQFKLQGFQTKRRETEVRMPGIAEIISRTDTGSTYSKNKLYIKIIDIVVAALVCGNIVMSIIDNELYIKGSNTFIDAYVTKYNLTAVTEDVLVIMKDREISPEENTCRFVNILIVITNLFCIYLHYFFKIKILKADHKLSEYDNIFTSGLYKYLAMELFVCAFFYPPFLNQIIYGNMLNSVYVYNVNGLISFVVMLKSYIILRVYSYFSRWTSDTANSVCNKYKVRAGIYFAIKAELKKRPYTILTITLLIVIAFCGYAIRTFEYGIYDQGDNSLKSLTGINPLQQLQNCLWLVVITMTTVGYGDMYPRSHLGRFVGIVACIIGMLLVSLIVVSMAVVAEFTVEEKKAYSLLKKLQADDSAYSKAANVIVNIIKLRQSGHSQTKNKIGRSRMTERFIILTQLKREISYFKNDFKLANSFSLPLDEMLKRLENKMKGDIQELTTNFKKIATVEPEMNTISDAQDYVANKMTKILARQEAVAQYIVSINNEKYKKKMMKMFRDKIDHNTIVGDKAKGKKLSSEKVTMLVPRAAQGETTIKERPIETVNVSSSDDDEFSKSIEKSPEKDKANKFSIPNMYYYEQDSSPEIGYRKVTKK